MICTKCITDKILNDFNKSSRHASGFCTWCKSCEAVRKKDWLIANPSKAKNYANTYRSKNKKSIYAKNLKREKEKHIEKLARMAVGRAVKRGELLRPKECNSCTKKCKPEGHHFDYSKPLEVRWLCKSCHALEHSKLRKHCGIELVADWKAK